MSNESNTGQEGDRSIHPSGFEFKAFDQFDPSTGPLEGPKTAQLATAAVFPDPSGTNAFMIRDERMEEYR